MDLVLPDRLTVDEFLRWSARQESGRYELEGGRIIMQQAQTVGHAMTKARIFIALVAAIERAGAHFYAVPDGVTVPISDDRGYEPDALVAPLPKVDEASLKIANPIIVVEVVSPLSIKRDLTTKVAGYSSVPTIEHYLVVDPNEREVLHYRRRGDLLVPPEAPARTEVVIDPPGLRLPVADLLLPGF